MHPRLEGTDTWLSGTAPLIGVEHPEDSPQDLEEEYVPSPGLLIGGAFAFNAPAWLAVPATAGDYDLCVSQAGATSNVVKVTIAPH